jgi:glycosyltransferase involved in cell wall biosynthesis
MKGDMPLVSVITASYNCAEFVGAAIESALAQTYPHREIIVVDDGSTDGTAQALRGYGGRIVYHRQENRGVSAARNQGIRLAKGEILAFLDADDLWWPEKLERQVAALQQHPDAALVFTDGVEIDERGVVQKETLLPTTPGSFSTWLPQYGDPRRGWVKGRWFARLVKANFIRTVSQVAIRRECLETVGGFNERLQEAEDIELSVRIAHRYPLVFLPGKLTRYRRRPEGISGPMEGRQFRSDRSEAAMYSALLPRFGGEERRLIHRRLGFLYGKVAWNYFNQEQFREARAMFRRSLRHDPWAPWAILRWAAAHLPPGAIRGLRRAARRLRGRAA